MGDGVNLKKIALDFDSIASKSSLNRNACNFGWSCTESPSRLQIFSQRLPVILLPPFVHADVIVRGHIRMDQINPPVFRLLHESQNENGIQIAIMKHHAAPTLDDQFSGNGEEGDAGEHSIERGEFAVGLCADFDRRSSDGGMAPGIHVNAIKLAGAGRESDGMFDGFEHDGVISSRRTAGLSILVILEPDFLRATKGKP